MQMTPDQFAGVVSERVNMLFLICIRGADVYQRLRGGEAFYTLILADWNAAHHNAPFSPSSLQELVGLFVGARRRYFAQTEEPEEDESATKTRLASAVDHFTDTIDTVDSTVATRAVP
ncbi:hypothetical protein M426DRAFT_317942, partial [Hypoxylon sp. CI-4A]